MSKHASPSPRRLGQLKVLGTVVLVVAFVALFVGGATGLIGSGGGSGQDGDSATNAGAGTTPGGSAGSTTSSAPSGGDTATAGPSSDPTAVVTDVPPQTVKDAKKLKRSLAYLRRGLADETTFRVGTFNVLGSSHTAKVGGNKRGYGSGPTRMGMAYSLITQADLDVVGLQEFEDPQYAAFRNLAGSRWDLYPGPTLDTGSIRDSIAWRTDTWDLVEATSIAIPYFHGQMIRRPVIKLKNKASGREVWFFNTHNPADTPQHGNNAHWRGVAIGLEIQLANQLSADGTPVVFTGDYNDREAAVCPIVTATSMVTANGAYGSDGCHTPSNLDIDWIFGSGIQFSDYVSASNGIVGRVSDHPFVYAQGYIPQEPLGGQQPGTSATDAPSGDASATESPSDGSSSGN